MNYGSVPPVAGYPAPPQSIITVQPSPNTAHVILVGGCPACRVCDTGNGLVLLIWLQGANTLTIRTLVLLWTSARLSSCVSIAINSCK